MRSRVTSAGALMITSSTCRQASTLSVLSCTFMMGRCAPRWAETSSSGWIPTMRKSPNFLASLRMSTCPGWNMSKAPSMYTTLSPGLAVLALENWRILLDVGRKLDTDVCSRPCVSCSSPLLWCWEDGSQMGSLLRGPWFGSKFLRLSFRSSMCSCKCESSISEPVSEASLLLHSPLDASCLSLASTMGSEWDDLPKLKASRSCWWVSPLCVEEGARWHMSILPTMSVVLTPSVRLMVRNFPAFLAASYASRPSGMRQGSSPWTTTSMRCCTKSSSRKSSPTS
mmetsp:Transcript_2181/g.14452  ORF Transcript_2181/g.14452 Transcript_2181/m.14452 type:complete len:283 (+) Transcript_2181:5516-6364(+)